jgi:DNA topoisomerase III
MIYSSVAKRQLSAEEIATLLRDKSIPLLSGFLSTKTGKTFNAGLKLTGAPDFKVEFVFENR